MRILVAILSFIVCLSASSQTADRSYSFLNIPSSSRVSGLGGVNIALIDDDVSMAQDNPALIGPEIDRQISIGYMRYFGSSNFAGVRYGMASGEHGAWAAGIRYLDYGEFSGYLPDGSPEGGFHPMDVIVEGTYSHDFTYRLRGGINVKMIYSGYEDYSALALAADIGMNYYDEENDFSLSLVLKNMGGQLKRFEEHYDRLPFDVQLGFMKGLGESPFAFGVTARDLTRWHQPYYRITDEEKGEYEKKDSFGKNLFRHLVFCLQYIPSGQFYLDFGYNYKIRSDMSAYRRSFLSGVSAGFGIKARTFSVGMSYSMPHRSASTLQLNLVLNLSELI